jgi:hypothetical protein
VFLALLVAAELLFHLPTQEASSQGGCLPAEAPLTDLDSVFLGRQERWGTLQRLEGASCRGMEGLPWSFSVPDNLAVYAITTKDIAGNESCFSNLHQVGGNVSVPPPLRAVVPLKGRFDLQGRRIGGKLPQGRYFGRDTTVIR